MALLNYTTGIDADKSAAEIAKMLAKAGASAILTEYDPTSSYVESLSFRMNLEGTTISFRLPTNWKPVQEVLIEQKRRNSRINTSREQAVRVAWRIVKDWVEAQLAIIETRMVSTTQVFLPYAVTKDNRTLFETIAQNPSLLLGPPQE